MVTCKACEEAGFPRQFKAITHRHLKTQHNMTIAEYCAKYPDAVLRDNREKWVSKEIALNEPEEKIIGSLTETQQRYVMARLQCGTKNAAARMVGISNTTPYNWKNLQIIEALIGHLSLKPVLEGLVILQDAIPEAALNIKDLQHSDDDSVALRASQDILDRTGVSAKKGTTVQTSIYMKMELSDLDEEIRQQMAIEDEAIEAEFEEIK